MGKSPKPTKPPEEPQPAALSKLLAKWGVLQGMDPNKKYHAEIYFIPKYKPALKQ